jgi:hypothetical protein
MGFRGFPPIHQKNANGWGTELVQEQAARELDPERFEEARLWKRPDWYRSVGQRSPIHLRWSLNFCQQANALSEGLRR